MLKLNRSFASAFVAEDELVSYMDEHADVLARCQAGEDRYADSLGWLSVDEWASDAILDRTCALAEQIRSMADTFVVIGVGGSNNGSRSVQAALAPEGARLVWAGNTLSAWELNRVLDELEGHDVVIDCIAKNFETLEPGSSFRLLRQYLVERYGREEAARRIVCTGTIGSPLEDLCRAEGYTFVPFATNVGGRYTALTEVHLLPMAVAGVDIRALVAGARTMERLLRTAPAGENSAFAYASARNMLWDRGYRVELLSFFEPRFRWFSKWWSSSSPRARERMAGAYSPLPQSAPRSSIAWGSSCRTVRTSFSRPSSMSWNRVRATASCWAAPTWRMPLATWTAKISGISIRRASRRPARRIRNAAMLYARARSS